MGPGPISYAPPLVKTALLLDPKNGARPQYLIPSHKKVARPHFLADIIHSKFYLSRLWLDREGNCLFLFRLPQRVTDFSGFSSDQSSSI
jgi:hypothetical protein